MADNSSSQSPSVEGLAEVRSVLSHAIADAAHSRALLAQQRERLIDKRDALVRAGQSRAVDSAVLIADSEHIVADLRQTVEECTRQLRRQQVPPETVLATVKAVTSSAAQAELGSRDVQVLVSEVVGWCINAYYSAA
jgi:hypothetical protein